MNVSWKGAVLKKDVTAKSEKQPLGKKLCWIAIAIIVAPALVLCLPFFYILDKKYDEFCP
jgi:hypothetical protein